MPKDICIGFMRKVALETELNRQVGSDSTEINQKTLRIEDKAWTQARNQKLGKSKIDGTHRKYPQETRMVIWKTKFGNVSATVKNQILFSKQQELLKVYDQKNVMIDAHSYVSTNKIKLFKKKKTFTIISKII